MLVDSVQQVNSMQLEANRAVEELMTGGDVNPAEVLTAVQKADLAFRMVMQVGNKLVAACAFLALTACSVPDKFYRGDDAGGGGGSSDGAIDAPVKRTLTVTRSGSGTGTVA